MIQQQDANETKLFAKLSALSVVNKKCDIFKNYLVSTL